MLVSLLANWVRIEPTPPAAPTISSVSPALPPSCTPRRWNSNSQAVIAVRGSAAAAAFSSERGFSATMRSSTSCSSLLLPGRPSAPAYHTSSPGVNSVTASPTAFTTPTASQPSTRGVSALNPARTLVSTGFTEMALTSTSRSCPCACGSGRSISRKKGMLLPSAAAWVIAMAFIGSPVYKKDSWCECVEDRPLYHREKRPGGDNSYIKKVKIGECDTTHPAPACHYR